METGDSVAVVICAAGAQQCTAWSGVDEQI
jgi:hypothetical protein